MELFLKDKNVVVTGGSKGIGFACAQGFLDEGASVTIIGSNKATIDLAKNNLKCNGGKLNAICSDLSKVENARGLKDLLTSTDILVNNAGAIPGGGLDAIASEAWHEAWELKVHGYIEMSRLALAPMYEKGEGAIINIIGIFGASPKADYLCGAAGNAALIAFTQALGSQSAKKGVRVLGINPGATRTERLEKLYRSRAVAKFGDENRWKELLGDLPFGRLAEPTEIADLTVFLASKRASYLSGVVIDADGGNRYA